MFWMVSFYQPGAVGIAWLQSTCDSDPFYRSAVVEYYQSDLITGQVIVS